MSEPREAADAAGIEIRDARPLRADGERLLAPLAGGAVLISRGGGGPWRSSAGGRPAEFPTVAREVYDVTGAATRCSPPVPSRSAPALVEEATRWRTTPRRRGGKIGTAR